MRFIDINSCKLLFDIGTADRRISSVSVSPSGRHIVAVVDSGNMHVYSVHALTSELNKVSNCSKSLYFGVTMLPFTLKKLVFCMRCETRNCVRT